VLYSVKIRKPPCNAHTDLLRRGYVQLPTCDNVKIATLTTDNPYFKSLVPIRFA
jgi:hypothetical protein